ncbi:MAG TPA: histidine--tRNA ligase [Candidatus Acidoferrales bacterium]|jgi:histidyl-tRNA synthetase|nr:histidine--tRNA ligase [Candidatus Acidoferrales bacterium]
MTEKRQFRAIKGTRDILSPDSALWNWFERTAREVFETYGFGEIRLPIFEETELFARSIGVDTDVVGKEMFSFEERASGELAAIRTTMLGLPPLKTPQLMEKVISLASRFAELADQAAETDEIPSDKGNLALVEAVKANLAHIEDIARLADSHQLKREIFEALGSGLKGLVGMVSLGENVTLRPEATAGVARAYIEHGMHTLPGNVKLYYVGPMFRRERPQKGRYRQFYQVGAEVLGQSDAPAIDAEVLEMLLALFARVGLTNTKLYVNSIGCKECRPKYVELLRGELRKVQEKLGADSQRRIETNPLRVLDSKLPDEQPVIETLPRIADHLCADCREHFAKLKDELKLRGIAFEENWRLVRGLDYYTRTTFEVTAAGLGSQNAVCGGGRYDGLVELLGGQPTKGIGFAIGTDRAILSIQEGSAPKLPGLAVYVAWMGAKTYPTAVAIARKLRECGLGVELPPEEMKFKKSLGLADKLGARYAVIIGEDEVASGTYTLKRLADAEQKKLNENDLLEYLESERRSG